MHSVAKGKRSELYMMAVLLENGFKVFQALADTEGIDYIVLGEGKEGNKFYPVQIKSREEFYKGGDVVSVSRFTENMFIIIYDVQTKKYWIIPSDEYRSLSRPYPKNDPVEHRLTYKKNRSALEKYEGENGIEVLRSRMYPTTPQLKRRGE